MAIDLFEMPAVNFPSVGGGLIPATVFLSLVPLSSGDSGASPPSIVAVSPTPGPSGGSGFPSDIATARATPIVLEINSPGGVAYVLAVCRYPGAADEIVVFAKGAFRGTFALRSTVELVGTLVRLHVLPASGWTDTGALEDIAIDVDAIGGNGQALSSTRSP